MFCGVPNLVQLGNSLGTEQKKEIFPRALGLLAHLLRCGGPVGGWLDSPNPLTPVPSNRNGGGGRTERSVSIEAFPAPTDPPGSPKGSPCSDHFLFWGLGGVFHQVWNVLTSSLDSFGPKRRSFRPLSGTQRGPGILRCGRSE